MQPPSNRLRRYLAATQEILLAFAILLIATLTITNVICRFLLGFSLSFAGEVIEFCIIGVCFVGVAYAAARARHIRMTAIYDLLSPRFQKPVLMLTHLLTFLLVVLLTYFSARYVYSVYQLGGIYPATRVPFYLVYSLAPLGFLLAAIEYGLALWQNMANPEIYAAFGMKQAEKRAEPEQGGAV